MECLGILNTYEYFGAFNKLKNSKSLKVLYNLTHQDRFFRHGACACATAARSLQHLRETRLPIAPAGAVHVGHAVEIL